MPQASAGRESRCDIGCAEIVAFEQKRLAARDASISAPNRSTARSTRAVFVSPIARASFSTFATTFGLAICNGMANTFIEILIINIHNDDSSYQNFLRLDSPARLRNELEQIVNIERESRDALRVVPASFPASGHRSDWPGRRRAPHWPRFGPGRDRTRSDRHRAWRRPQTRGNP